MISSILQICFSIFLKSVAKTSLSSFNCIVQKITKSLKIFYKEGGRLKKLGGQGGDDWGVVKGLRVKCKFLENLVLDSVLHSTNIFLNICMYPFII